MEVVSESNEVFYFPPDLVQDSLFLFYFQKDTRTDRIELPFPSSFLKNLILSFNRGYTPKGKSNYELIRFAIFINNSKFLYQLQHEVDYYDPELYRDFFQGWNEVWFELFLYVPYNFIPLPLKENNYFKGHWIKANTRIREVNFSDLTPIERRNFIQKVNLFEPLVVSQLLKRLVFPFEQNLVLIHRYVGNDYRLEEYEILHEGKPILFASFEKNKVLVISSGEQDHVFLDLPFTKEREEESIKKAKEYLLDKRVFEVFLKKDYRENVIPSLGTSEVVERKKDVIIDKNYKDGQESGINGMYSLNLKPEDIYLAVQGEMIPVIQ